MENARVLGDTCPELLSSVVHKLLIVNADAASSRCCRRRPRDVRRLGKVIHTSMSLRRVSPICSEV